MKTSPRPELRAPVEAFGARLRADPETIPLADLAALFGADEALLERVRARGDLKLEDGRFVNDGPELVVPAGKVELEIPNVLSGTWRADADGFALAFPMPEFTLRACATVAVFRKCFDLRELRASANDLVLDFGGGIADRRYTF